MKCERCGNDYPSEIMDGVTKVLCYGTAVVVEPEAHSHEK